MPRAVWLTSGITGRFFQSSGAGVTRWGEAGAEADAPVGDAAWFTGEGVINGVVSLTSPFKERVGT